MKNQERGADYPIELKSDELILGYGGDDLSNRFRSSDKKGPNEDWNANGECDVGHRLVKGRAENALPGEEQSEGKPTEENETQYRNDANIIGFSVTEGEQRASYAAQEKEHDNDISSDNQGGKKPKLWLVERKSVHAPVCTHVCANVNTTLS